MNFTDPAFFVLKGTITKTLTYNRVVLTPIPPGEMGGLETERLLERLEKFKQDYNAAENAKRANQSRFDDVESVKFHISMRSKNYRQPLTFGLQMKGVEPPALGVECECSVNLELYDYVSINPNPKENPNRKGEPIAGVSLVCTGWRHSKAEQ
jgi:hypothetical protein